MACCLWESLGLGAGQWLEVYFSLLLDALAVILTHYSQVRFNGCHCGVG
jgi:hypothetical protein